MGGQAVLTYLRDMPKIENLTFFKEKEVKPSKSMVNGHGS